jgi:ABC-type transport system substrate-binding protein
VIAPRAGHGGAGLRLGLAALCALALGGCGGAVLTAGVPPARTFIDLVPQLPGDLDASATPSTAGAQILPSWASELVRPAPSSPGPKARLKDPNDVVPYLATSWRELPGGDYVFQLRRGVRGATGDLFTAADVSWSFARALAVTPEAPFLLGLANVDLADPVTVLGRYSVRINVTAPSPFLLGVLSSDQAAIYDSALYLRHASGADPWGTGWGATNSATFGAYSVHYFEPGRKIVLKANPGSWVHPYYRAVLIKEAPDSSRRVVAVLNGSADHASGADWTDYFSAIESGRHDHVTATILQSGPEVQSWALNVRSGPLANVLVRRALSLAVNRPELLQTLNDGYGTPAVKAVPAIDGQPQGAPVDLALARRLLREAGYPHGLTVDVYTSAFVPGGEMALLSQQLAQIGVTLVPTTVYDEDQLFVLERAHEVPSSIDDITPLVGGAGFTLLQNYDAALDSDSQAAETGYANPTLDGLLAAIRRSPDGPSYDRLVARAEAIVDADVPVIGIFEDDVQNITKSDIAGYAAYNVPVTYYENLHPAR